MIRVFAAAILASLACAGVMSPGEPVTEVPVCAPFDKLGLPLNEGRATSCSESSIVMQFDNASPHTLGQRYRTILGDRGWKEKNVESTDNTFFAALSRGGQELTLDAQKGAGVTLTIRIEASTR